MAKYLFEQKEICDNCHCEITYDKVYCNNAFKITKYFRGSVVSRNDGWKVYCITCHRKITGRK